MIAYKRSAATFVAGLCQFADGLDFDSDDMIAVVATAVGKEGDFQTFLFETFQYQRQGRSSFDQGCCLLC